MNARITISNINQLVAEQDFGVRSIRCLSIPVPDRNMNVVDNRLTRRPVFRRTDAPAVTYKANRSSSPVRLLVPATAAREDAV
jgi:hypothetical protein